jgi:hypothetical protein
MAPIVHPAPAAENNLQPDRRTWPGVQLHGCLSEMVADLLAATRADRLGQRGLLVTFSHCRTPLADRDCIGMAQISGPYGLTTLTGGLS